MRGERERQRKKEREKETFHLLVHWPIVPKAGAGQAKAKSQELNFGLSCRL